MFRFVTSFSRSATSRVTLSMEAPGGTTTMKRIVEGRPCARAPVAAMPMHAATPEQSWRRFSIAVSGSEKGFVPLQLLGADAALDRPGCGQPGDLPCLRAPREVAHHHEDRL